MKKTLSLILAIVLSMSVFFTNIAGIRMIVMADEPQVEVYEGGDTDDSQYQEEPQVQPDPGPSEDPEPPAPVPSEPSEEEKARQEALEKQAQEAEEAAKKQAEDEAAAEALKKAQEEEEARQKAEEEAKKAEEDAKKKQAATLDIKANMASVDFGSAAVGTQRDVKILNITNLGSNEVTLQFNESDPDQAFGCSLHGESNSNVLGPGDTAKYNISMSSKLAAGSYSANIYFTDVTLDPDNKKGITIPLSGTVTPKSASVTGVEITPAKVSVAVDNSYKFYATVKGDGEVKQDVRWSMANNNSGKSFIDDDGILYVAKDETSGSITVIATSVQDSSEKGYATVTPQRNSVNVSVVAKPSNGGNVAGGGAVSQGGSVTLTAAPNKNYYFAGWVQNGNVVSRSTNYTIDNIQNNITVTAKFALNAVTVKAEPNNGNAGTVVGGGTFAIGSSTTLSAKAYDGYVFTGWNEGNNIISRDASIRLDNLTVNREITGMFEQTSHTLTLSASPYEGGRVEGGGTFGLNQGTTAKAIPNPGYTFVGWQVNGQIVNRDATVKIDKLERDYNCVAIFMQTGVVTYEMSSGVATTGGSITPSGRVTVAQGQNLTYTMTPKAGFAVLAVAVDGVQVGPVSTYTFSNIQGNHSIAVAFLQTDAGKAAAAASGQPVQEQKVQKIEKVSANTATSESTVSIEEAAKGAGGDSYVEEMNLDGVNVPSDEELGIQAQEVDESTPVSQMMGVSITDARNMAAAGNNAPILDAAFYAGTLGASVINTYEPANKHSVDYQNMTAEELMQTSDDEINPSLPNLDVVVQKMLTPDEVMSLVNGGAANVSVALTKQDNPDPSVKKIMKNAVGKKPLQYFDLTLMKTMNGYSENVTSIPEPMTVVIEIPGEIYKKGKSYSILTVHNGELKALPDLDDDPETITFCTDKFSPYAIAEDVASARGMLTWLFLGAMIALAVALTCFMILVAHQANMRKARRRARAEARRERDERG